MKYITDFHIHSKYSRATSRDMDIPTIAQYAKIKGIDIVATGDWTHQAWLTHLKKNLKPLGNGLLKYDNIYFILSTEISCIYKKGDKTRKIHNLIIAPDFKTIEKINKKLNQIGNLKSDGRPILGLDAKDLAKIALNASKDCIVIPAHIWTPWFSLFGDKSGFDTIEECFEELTPYIHAMETGLSSDPGMNWRWSKLDNITLISNSDAHSPRKMGREANILELEKLSYKNIYKAVCGKHLKLKSNNKLIKTLEFFPQQGKYHFDGHRACNICLTPIQTKKHKYICPKCKRPVTVGVMHRVDALSDRPGNKQGSTLKKPQNAAPYKNLIPLEEIIANSYGMGPNTKTVAKEYNNLISNFKNEFNILLNTPRRYLQSAVLNPNIAEGIMRVRKGKVYISPGYDGEYGKISIFTKQEQGFGKKQAALF
ncbi:DNA helicase UvrD [bacterium]|nr:DNA helicase UvrD [bacterium]